MLAPCKESYDKPRQSIKKQRRYFANKDPSSQSDGFSNDCVWMWELGHKEGWMLKNWYFRIVVLEKTLESPLDSKEIKPVNIKGNQPWIFIGRIDAEAEAPVLWPPDVKNWLTGKTLMQGKEKGRQRMKWLESIIDSMGMNWANSGRQWRTGKLGVLQSTGSQSRTRLSDWSIAS